jgi:hypothetical protein
MDPKLAFLRHVQHGRTANTVPAFSLNPAPPYPAPPSGSAGAPAPDAGIDLSVTSPARMANNANEGPGNNWGNPLGQDFFNDGSLHASFTYYGAAGRGGSLEAVGLSLSLLSN